MPESAVIAEPTASAPPTEFTERATWPTAARTQTFDIDCALSYEVQGPTEFLFQVHAQDGMDQQVLSESVQLTPELPFHVYADPALGHRVMRVHAEAGPLQLRYLARVTRTVQPADPLGEEVPIAQIPDELLHCLNPTRYCESDHLSRVAQKMFGALPPGFERVRAIEQWIHDHVDYQVGSTQATTTARDVLLGRVGVCRDFAHLGITLCRALNIPARFVAAYARFAEPPPDFHALFEAYLGRRWVMFDATRMAPIDDVVRIATGSDAKDVAFATIFGPAVMSAMQPLIRKLD